MNKSVEIGIAQMKEFQRGLPGGFQDTISKLVITMKKGGKKLKKKEEIIEPYNTELLFARVTYLLDKSKLMIFLIMSYLQFRNRFSTKVVIHDIHQTNLT